MQFQISRAFVALMAGSMLLTGCQSYERKPLDLAATRDAWLTRLPSDETASEFAQRISDNQGYADTHLFDLSDGLSLAEAELVALVFNRNLRLARLEANVTRATAEHAGLWDDPALDLNFARIISGVPDPWVAGGAIGLTIPISGRLEAQKEKAGAKHTAELHRLAATEWATRTALRKIWIKWSAQMARAKLMTKQIDRLRSAADFAHRQEQAGVLSKIEERLLRVELAGSQAQIIETIAIARDLELQLRDILGLAPDAPVQLVETVVFVPRGTGRDWLLDSMETGNLELVAVRSEYEVAEESLRLEIRKQYPDLTIGPGFGGDEGDERLLLGVRLPIPLWNRNQQSVAEAHASREVAYGRFENTYERLASRLAIVLIRYEAGRAMRQAVETSVVPLADEQDANVRRVAELDRVDPLLLLQAIKVQHEAKVRLVDARVSEAIGAIGLDYLIGPPVSVEGIPHSSPISSDPNIKGDSP
ncbi:MAG: TolC family protein [Phycisphaerales bacterium]|nr:TolC family protein [Phycisphaerales bacterium]